MEPLLGISLCYNISKRFDLKQKACDVFYKIRYILWVTVPLGACDVIQDGRHFGRHLGFYRKLEIVEKRKKKMETLGTGHVATGNDRSR